MAEEEEDRLIDRDPIVVQTASICATFVICSIVYETHRNRFCQQKRLYPLHSNRR